MRNVRLQYSGQLMRRADSLKKPLMLGKIEGRRRRGRQRMRWLDGVTDSVDMGLGGLRETVRWWWSGKPGVLWSTGSQRVSDLTEQLNNNNNERWPGWSSASSLCVWWVHLRPVAGRSCCPQQERLLSGVTLWKTTHQALSWFTENKPCCFVFFNRGTVVYNVALVSSVQQSDSRIHKHRSIFYSFPL